MPTRTDAEVLRRAHARLVELAERDLDRFWESLDLNQPERARDELLEFVPTLTTVYGEASATVAADWYDDLRASEGVPGRFAAVMAAPFAVHYVQQRVRYASRHLFTDDPGAAKPFLMGAVQRYVVQPGRDTVTRSAARDPRASGWVRVTHGETCKFCVGLAARGAVYKESTVRFAAHDGCDCGAMPSWNPKAPEVPVEAYVASERTSGMTDEQKERHNARIREWLNREHPDIRG